jgi:hypothetical protein
MKDYQEFRVQAVWRFISGLSEAGQNNWEGKQREKGRRGS